MIYHAAFQLDPTASAASSLRPVKMFKAFESIGYEVFDLTGTSSERRRKFKVLRKQINSGTKFDFMYSESATIPVVIGNPSHFPHMFLDAQIFKFLKKKGVPTSVFYRDLYWVYDEYLERVKRPLADAMRILYKYELEIYRRFATVVFVPSLEMANEIPQLKIPNIQALPPGGEIIDAPTEPAPIHLFYVGGIGAHYRLHELVNAVREMPNVRLTICTGKQLWEQNKHEYGTPCSNIQVVHESGRGLDKYYSRANIAVVVVDPSHYRSFAVPVKLFEYVGRGKPIMATRGTLASQIVEKNEWGWVVENDKTQIEGLLTHLVSNPEEISCKTRKVQEDRMKHSWSARANSVKQILIED